MDKPIFEIPVTDPNAPPFGVPGAGGAMPSPRRESPPETSGPAPASYSQLPPPAVAPGTAGPPAPTPPAPTPPAATPPAAASPAAGSPPPATPGWTPAPEGLATPGLTPPPATGAGPAWSPAQGAAPIPGFTPAPEAPVIPLPEFREAPAFAPESPLSAAIEFEEDEFTRVARESADPDVIAALREVLTAGASDLHVSSGSRPLLRVDGGLRPVTDAPVWEREKVSAALRSLLTPEQAARFDEQLELDFAFTLSAKARFRVNFYQQRGAIGGAFRIIPTEIKQLAQLGVPEVVGDFAKLARGLVLVTGPTGSGKSTTLAALVDLVNRTRTDHIVTVEDPIEFLHQNQKSLVNQREVGHDTHSFANALKHVLRQDPDVILIGELRDLETISVALTAAETGHLVFATLHTQDAGQTIDRVIDVFPPHQQGQIRTQLAATLQGVVCQTLVKRPGGGRAVATEVMVTTPAIANLVREGKTYQVRSALQAGRAHGMHTMDQHLADLVNAGEVAYGAALEKAQDAEDFNRLVHRKSDSGDPVSFASRL